MSNTYEFLKLKSDLLLAMAAKSGLTDVRVFGSVARGDDTPESDIDLLVNVADASDPLAFVDFQMEAEKLLSRKVDLVFESGLYHAMRESVLREARPL
jgi:predicted nucleotidyltransferase